MKLLLSIPAAVALLALVIGQPSAHADRDEANPYIDVIILAGQSNMVGGGRTDDLSPHLQHVADPIEGLRYRSWINGWLDGDEWTDVTPRNGWLIGPEMMFGRVITESRDTDSVALVKMAYNGTSLLCDWSPDLCGTRIAQRIGPLLGTIREELGEEDLVVRFAGLIWVQGEADSTGMGGASNYAENFLELLEFFREATGHPELPAVVARVAPTASQYQHVPLMHEQMRAIAAIDPRVATVTCWDIPLKDDQVHFTSDGQVALGGRLADTFLALRPFENLPEPSPACEGDVNWDGKVDSGDLGLLITQWGSPGGDVISADFNDDGVVNSADLAVILLRWGPCES